MSNNLKRFFTIFLLVVSFSNILPQTFLTVDCSWTDLKFPFSSANTLYYDKQADDIYAAVLGGVYKLNSSNLSWTQMGTDPNNGIRPNANIISLYIDNSNVFYAGCV